VKSINHFKKSIQPATSTTEQYKKPKGLL